jgi:hypothetical protein
MKKARYNRALTFNSELKMPTLGTRNHGHQEVFQICPVLGGSDKISTASLLGQHFLQQILNPYTNSPPTERYNHKVLL